MMFKMIEVIANQVVEGCRGTARERSERDLIEVANSRAQGHLLAISKRSSLPVAVTDVLGERERQFGFHRG